MLFGHAHVAVREELGRHDASLEPGVALPFTTLGKQILLKGVQTPSQGAGISVWTQPQISAKHLAMLIGL